MQQRRNIGIMAHVDAGKTTTSERILFYTGKSRRIGEVDSGMAQMDWMEQEQQRGITIQSAATTCFWRDVQINLIDTPGHIDFTAEVERSLRVLDGAIAVFCAVGGVQPQTETVWRQANKYNVPRLAFINKMDRVGANFAHVIAQIEQKLGTTPIAVQLPVGSEEKFSGIIDLITQEYLTFTEESQGSVVERNPIPAHLLDEALAARHAMIDALSAFNDEMTDLLLEEQPVPMALIYSTLRSATIAQQITPVLTGSSLKNKGVQPLLDAVLSYLPSPEELTPIVAIHQGRKPEPLTLSRSEEGPLSALVFKIQQDKESGALCYVRVYSGVMRSGVMLYNVGKEKKERVGKLFRMHARTPEQIQELRAGDVGVVQGLKLAQTGDSLADQAMPILLESIDFPEPVVSIAIEPKTMSDMDRLREVLALLQREDPTFTTQDNKETGQLIISGMGELHLDVIVTRAAKEFNAQFNTGKPQISYRESIEGEATHQQIFDKTIAGKEVRAAITLQAKDAGRAKGNSFSCAVDRKQVPETYLQAIENGVRSAWASGIIMGYPAVDVAITLLDVEFDELTAHPFAFEAAGAMGFDAVCHKASPIILEPMMNLDILVPNDYVGDVISKLSARGGIVHGIENQNTVQQVKAAAPLRHMFGYSNELRSQTQGRGSFSMAFSHYEKKGM